MTNSLKRQYISDIGSLLSDFDQSHPEKSLAQQKEIAKHARIAHLRDHIVTETPLEDKKIWENF